MEFDPVVGQLVLVVGAEAAVPALFRARRAVDGGRARQAVRLRPVSKKSYRRVTLDYQFVCRHLVVGRSKHFYPPPIALDGCRLFTNNNPLV